MFELGAVVLMIGLSVALLGLSASVFVEALANAKATQSDAATRQLAVVRGRGQVQMTVVYNLNQSKRKGETTMFIFKRNKATQPVEGTAIVLSDRSEYRPGLPASLDQDPTGDNVAARVVGRNMMLYRPLIQLDPDTGLPGRGLTPQRVADYLTASLERDLQVPMTDVCEIQPRDHEGRFLLVHVDNLATEGSFDLAFPVGVITQELADVMGIYRRGLLMMIGEQHKRNQDLSGAQSLMDTAMQRLRALQNDSTPHANSAEYVFLEGIFTRARKYGAVVPVAAAGSGSFTAPRDSERHTGIASPPSQLHFGEAPASGEVRIH